MRRTINIDLKCRVKYHQKTTSDCEKGIATINFLQGRGFFWRGGGGGEDLKIPNTVQCSDWSGLF